MDREIVAVQSSITNAGLRLSLIRNFEGADVIGSFFFPSVAQPYIYNG